MGLRSARKIAKRIQEGNEASFDIASKAFQRLIKSWEKDGNIDDRKLARAIWDSRT